MNFTGDNFKGAAHDQFKSGELSQRILDMYEKAKLPVEMMINSLKLFKILFDKSECSVYLVHVHLLNFLI